MQNLIPTNAIENTARAKFFGELVLTTAQLAEFYGTSTDNIKKNFNANKERFIDGKHYYRLEGENLRRFQSDIAESSKRQNADLNLVTESYAVQEDNLHVTESYPQISSKARTLYVWTKRGAARHAKILNTDRAWDVFELLEDTYFKLIDGKNAPCRIQPVADLLPEKKPCKPLNFLDTCILIGMAYCGHSPQSFKEIAQDSAAFIAEHQLPAPPTKFTSVKDSFNFFYLN